MSTPARHLADQKETLLPQTLCELVNCGAEYPGGLLAHMLNRVDAKAVDVRVGDPILITMDEVLQRLGGSGVFRRPVNCQAQLFEINEVPFLELRIEIKISDPAFAVETAGGLQLSGPDCSIGPGRVEGRR